MAQRSIQANLGGLAAVALAVALITALALVGVSTWLHVEVTSQGVAVERVRAAEEIEVHLLEAQQYAVMRSYFDGDLHDADRRDAAWGQVWRWLHVAERGAGSPEETASLLQLRARVERVAEMWKEARSDTSPGGASATPEEVRGTQAAVAHALEAGDALIALDLKEARRSRMSAALLDHASEVVGISFASLAVVVLLAGVWTVRRVVVRPLERVRSAIVRFGAGDLRSRAPTDGPREIADIAVTFNETADALDRRRRNQLAFVASVAHDLKNPLQALKLAARVAERGGPDARAQANDLVTRQVDGLVRMVDDLLDASRIEAGVLELRLADVDMAALAREVVDLFRGSTDRHELALCCDGPVVAHVDGTRVSQVLTNLVSNALKYSPHGGRVRVSVDADEQEVVIGVADEGIGIPTEELSLLFQPFRRARAGREVARGSGLGLSVTRRIVEAHGGTLLVESRVGQGSTFTARMPRTCVAAAGLPSHSESSVEPAPAEPRAP